MDKVSKPIQSSPSRINTNVFRLVTPDIKNIIQIFQTAQESLTKRVTRSGEQTRAYHASSDSSLNS